mmetsp:Transcript_23741/g.80152  ORF Transcript_23741/g.80152 Transcript_23741/m.80152 type:complete len:224 (+) Transcript_23741:617-1288(+)
MSAVSTAAAQATLGRFAPSASASVRASAFPHHRAALWSRCRARSKSIIAVSRSASKSGPSTFSRTARTIFTASRLPRPSISPNWASTVTEGSKDVLARKAGASIEGRPRLTNTPGASSKACHWAGVASARASWPMDLTESPRTTVSRSSETKFKVCDSACDTLAGKLSVEAAWWSTLTHADRAHSTASAASAKKQTTTISSSLAFVPSASSAVGRRADAGSSE